MSDLTLLLKNHNQKKAEIKRNNGIISTLKTVEGGTNSIIRANSKECNSSYQ